MSVDLDRINNDLQSIVGEFEKLLDDGKYGDAIAIVDDIDNVLSNANDIELSRGTGTPDNKFHDLYLKLQEQVDRRASSHLTPAIGTTEEYKDLAEKLKKATARIFNTAAVRNELILRSYDLEMNDYRRALVTGVIEAKKLKKEYEKEKDKYDLIYTNLFSNQNTTPPIDNIEKILTLNNVYDIFDKIDDYLEENILNYDNFLVENDPDKKKKIEDEIEKVKDEIKKEIFELQKLGYDITGFGNIDDFLDVKKVRDSMSLNEKLWNETEDEATKTLFEIIDKIEEAQNGKFEYTDSDGNVINLVNDSLIKRFPDIKNVDRENYSQLDYIWSEIHKVWVERRDLDMKIKYCSSEIDVYQENIDTLDIEESLLSKNPNDRQAYIDNFDSSTISKVNSEKTMRHEDAKKKFYGDREQAKKYKEAWKRFMSHKKTQKAVEFVIDQYYDYDFEYLDDPYPEKEDDLKLMQIESWELRSRRTALVKKVLEKTKTPEEQARVIAKIYGDDTIKDLENTIASFANGSYSGLTNNPVTPDMIKVAKNDLNEARNRATLQYQRDLDYIKNYNSAHFDVRDTVALALTGGSAMMPRKNQDKKNRTVKDVLGAIFKFTPYTKKADGKRHILTTTLANIAGVASLPIRTLQVGIGVGVAGVTAAVGKLTGTYDMPTPYNVGYIHRKEARQEYLLKNGSTKVGAWFKSFFNVKVKDENGNKVKINDKLIADRCKLIDQSIEDKYIRGAREKLIHEQIEVRKNIEQRKKALRNQEISAEMYEDIYSNNPEAIGNDDVAMNTLEAEAIRRSALSIGGLTAPQMTKDASFIKNGAKRKNQFVQNNPGERVEDLNHLLNNNYNFNDTVGETIYTNPISRENIQRGNTKGMNLALRIAAASTLPAFKGILSKWTIKHKTTDQVIHGKHIEQTPNYHAGGKTIYEEKPIFGEVERKITSTRDVKISYDNATFGDIQRGADAHWSAKLDAYTGPHSAGHFSEDATQIQGFNVSFADPVTGQHIEWSTSINEYKTFIDNHGLHEFSNTYQDLSGITADAPISKLTEYMPDNIRESYLRYIEASSNKLEAFNDATQFAYGIPTKAAETMGQGWTGGNIPLDAVKSITEEKIKKFHDIIGYRKVPVTVQEEFSDVINGYDIPDKIIEAAEGTIELDQGVTIGAMSGVSELMGQWLSPRYRKAEKNTRNYYDKFNDGRLKVTGRQGKYDMYDTPVTEDGDPSKNIQKKVNKYNQHHDQDDSAFNTLDSKGNPIVIKDEDDNVIPRIWDDDDFTL